VAARDDRDLFCQDFEGDPGLGFAQPGSLLAGSWRGLFSGSERAVACMFSEWNFGALVTLSFVLRERAGEAGGYAV
jgi:hypothetical protein